MRSSRPDKVVPLSWRINPRRPFERIGVDRACAIVTRGLRQIGRHHVGRPAPVFELRADPTVPKIEPAEQRAAITRLIAPQCSLLFRCAAIMGVVVGLISPGRRANRSDAAFQQPVYPIAPACALLDPDAVLSGVQQRTPVSDRCSVCRGRAPGYRPAVPFGYRGDPVPASVGRRSAQVAVNHDRFGHNCVTLVIAARPERGQNSLVTIAAGLNNHSSGPAVRRAGRAGA